MLKRKIAEILRKIHLLQLADSALLIIERLRNYFPNSRFSLQNPYFKTPPAHLAYDAYNHVRWQTYHDMGRRHAELIADLIKKHVKEQNIKIFEWGCGPARVIRHLTKIEGFRKIDIFGADYNKESIRWCQKNIDSISFMTSQLKPPLPNPIKDFDCIYALSVFTHLSERMHYEWMDELLKALKPDGILIFTTQGDIFKNRLLLADREKYEIGQLVVKDQIQEGKKHFSAFHPPDFVINHLLKDCVVVQHIESPTSYSLEQDVWVVKRPIVV